MTVPRPARPAAASLPRRPLACFVLALPLAWGCSMVSDYERPEVELPAAWNVDLEAAAEAANLAWWGQFEDPVLDELIETAIRENKDLRLAVARVDEFAARLRATKSEFLPQVGYGVGVGRDQRSLERGPPLVGDEERLNTNYEATLGASWEIDLWGRIANATEASRAELFAAEENRQALVLSLVSVVATSYLELLSLDSQLRVTQDTAAFRKVLLDTFERKAAGGQVSGLELAQVRHSYQQAAAAVPRIELRIALTENALSILLGRNPGPIRRGATLDGLRELEIPQGIPADVLSRRPDVREREQLLIAAHARMGEVRARYYPDITLTGLFGFASNEISTWIEDSSSLWHLGASLVGPLFTGGRIAGEVQQAEAQREQMLQAYLGTIQSALREVEDALVAVRKERELLVLQDELVVTLEEYATLARDRYDAGLSGYLEILDADRNLYNTRISRAQSRRDLLAALVESYKAMGAGWDPAPAPVEEAP